MSAVRDAGSGLRLSTRTTLVFATLAALPLAVVTYLMLRDFDAPARSLFLPTTLLGGVTIVATVLASLVVTEPTARSLRQLERVARRLRAGDFAAPERLDEYSELGEVSRELRKLAADLEQQRLELDLAEARWRAAIQELEIKKEVLEGHNARLLAHYDALQQFAGAIARILDPAQIAGELLTAVSKEVEYHDAAVFLVNPETDELVPVAVWDHGSKSVGNYLREISGRCRGPGRSIAEWCRQVGRTVRLEDLTQDGRWTDQDPNIRSVLAVPLEVKERIIGVLHLGHELPRYYKLAGVQELVTMLARQAALSIEHNRLLEEAARVEALRRLDRLKSELLSAVSHELRTPLAMIKGYASSLLREDVAWDEETRREFLQVIDEESDRLHMLIDDLLQMSEIEAGILRIHRQPLTIGKLVHRVVKRVRAHADNHTITTHVPTRLPWVNADPARVEQVLRNLVTNAIKYSPNGGTIRLHVSAVVMGEGNKHWPAGDEPPTHVLISVRDEGIGIAPEHLELIFERFYRVDGEATRKAGGSGLGLAICRGIVEAHGGTIWAESTPGEGSTFFFTLPVLEGESLDLEEGGVEE